MLKKYFGQNLQQRKNWWYNILQQQELKMIYKVIKSIDWELLRRQKEWLINHNADGLLSLVDALQDAAVADNIATELEVFGVLE